MKDWYYNIVYYILFLVVIFFGLYIRFDDVKFWRERESFSFYKGEPLYAEYDSFYFARLSRDIKEGLFKSGEVDKFRFFPDNTKEAYLDNETKFYTTYRIPGNFISYIFNLLSEITGISVAWLTYYLIPFFAITLVIPLYFYFKELGLPFVGIFGGLIGVSAPMYLGRTGLMRLDHDPLNLTLPFLVAFFYLKFFKTTDIRFKYFWITLASLTSVFYYLWYAHSNLNFVLVVTFILVLFYDSIKEFILKRKISFKITKHEILYLSILILPQIWYLYTGPGYLIFQIKTLVLNIKSPSAVDILFKDFPNILISISELQKMTFWEVFSATIYNQYFGLIGLIGAIFLFLFRFRDLFFLLPFFCIGLLTFFSGARFAMYLGPFLGMGLGYLVHLLFQSLLPRFEIFTSKHKQRLAEVLIGLLLFISVLGFQKNALSLVSTPKITASLVRDMEWLKKHTPEDSVIWTWWDYGYAFPLYARRTVVHDGGSQTSPKTYFVARSFATHDPREGWLITSFVSNYGLTGLARIMKEQKLSAKEIVEKISAGEYLKEIGTPIYWVFTDDLIPKFAWIHYFGTYDFTKREGLFGRIFIPTCKVLNSHEVICPDIENAVINLTLGIIKVQNQTIPVRRIYYIEGEQKRMSEFYPMGYTVAIVKAGPQAGLVLAEPPSDESLFFKMFILRQYDPRYFELIYDNFPQMVVYKVKPN